jgi:hypothetical protein
MRCMNKMKCEHYTLGSAQMRFAVLSSWEVRLAQASASPLTDTVLHEAAERNQLSESSATSLSISALSSFTNETACCMATSASSSFNVGLGA